MAKDTRAEQRLPTSVATVYRAAEGFSDCEIVDLSAGGALIAADNAFEQGQTLRLSVPFAGMVDARVIDVTARGVHLAFFDLTPAQREAVRRLVFSRLCAVDA